MSGDNSGFAEKTREAFRTLTADQRGFIFKRVASREHKHGLFGTLFDRLQIKGFSRPQLAQTWLGQFPQRKVEAFLLSPKGEKHFKFMVTDFFVKCYRELNDRFLEISCRDEVEISVADAERCLGQVRQEMGSDPFLPLYEAGLHWLVVAKLEQSSQEGGKEDGAEETAASVAASSEQVVLEEPGSNRPEKSRDGLATIDPPCVEGIGSVPVLEVVERSKGAPVEEAKKREPPAEEAVAHVWNLGPILLEIERLTKQAANLRVAELATVTAELKRALDRLPELDGQLKGAAKRLHNKLALLRKIPWLSAFQPSEPVGAQPEATVGDEMRRMQQLDARLARLLQIVERVTELEGRVEEPLPSWTAPIGGGVQRMIEACEVRITDITAHIESAAALEKTLVDFVDSFGTTNEDTGPHLLENVSSTEFCDIALEILRRPAKADVSEAVRRLRGRADIAGVILAHLWLRDSSQAIALTRGAARQAWLICSRDQTAKFFAFLSYSQIREIAEGVPQWAPLVAELLFAGAVARNRPELLEYLDPIVDFKTMHVVCSAFYRAVVAGFHRGQLGTPRSWMEGESMARADADAERAAERQRQELLDYIRRTPGMTKSYHRMRVFGRSKFLRPLDQPISARDSEVALRQWVAFGGLDRMVDECAGAIEGPYSLDQSHYQQTRRYLTIFEEKLAKWHQMTTRVHLPAGAVTPIRDAVAGLRREADRGSAANSSCRSLLELLQVLAGGGDDPSIPASDFGERCDGEGRVHVDPDAVTPLVTPFMKRSWPATVAEECVSVNDILHDWLRSGIQDAEPAGEAIVRSYVQRGYIEAARRMGERRKDWGKTFAAEIEKLTSSFRENHSGLLIEARNAREADRDVSECLVEIENALAGTRLGEAEDWIGYLGVLVDAYRKRRDPVLCSLREFLTEAGRAPDENLGADELRDLVQTVRKEHAQCRVHVDELIRAAQQSGWPLALRARWEEAAAHLDRPQFWPQAVRAAELGNAVRILGFYMGRKLKWRETDPSTTDAIVEGLGNWVPARLNQCLEKIGGNSGEDLAQLVRLANDVEEDCPSAHVLQVVGVARVVAPPATEGMAGPDALERSIPALVPTAPSEQVVGDLREEMRQLLSGGKSGGKPDAPGLRDALRRRDWKTAQVLSADWLATHANIAVGSSMSDTEAACLLSVAGDALEAAFDTKQERLWALGCLALGAADLSYYLTAEAQEELAARLFARLAGQLEAGSNAGQVLKIALEEMDDLPSTEVRSRPVAQMFRTGAQLTSGGSGIAATRFARLLWNGLRMETNYKPRASLLHLLFRLGQMGVIEALADTARPHQQLVVNCVRAFAHADSNPDARLHGLQLRKALEDRGGLRPWQLFMKQIDAGQATNEQAAVECRLESDFVTQEPSGRRTIELRLIPSLANPPQVLMVKLGAESSKAARVILQNEPLYWERTVTIEIPGDIQASEGGMARIPFEITGQTIFEKPVQVRGAWDVKFDDKPAVPIPPEEITRAWPGASGNPVTRMKGFHGRDKELAAICAYVEAPARPRSVMVFGQRRIGKTSLLKEVVSSFDPDRDGVTGAFFDVSGLKFAADGSGMATAFFRYVTSQMRGPDNAHLKVWLSAEAQERLEQRLAGMDPEASLLDCFDTVAQHFSEASQGRVRRLAFLVDEFDRFVQPLLSGQRELVQRFLWNLRQVVQRGDRVSLILAGSGLQKLLKQGYEDALFGSIDEVHLEPFSWEEDRDAVLDTVFPGDFRSRLCRPQEAERLAEKACELCGGHPMFLALLGSATALLTGGRRLSPDFLNRVVERLVREGVNEPCLQINRKLFYTPTFQTLLRLPRRTRALAQLILVHIAERTTPDYAWESVANVTVAEDLPRDVSRNEALEGLKRLEEERVITWDRRSGSRVRITVPLTAAALRQEVLLLRDDAVQLFESQEESK